MESPPKGIERGMLRPPGQDLQILLRDGKIHVVPGVHMAVSRQVMGSVPCGLPMREHMVSLQWFRAKAQHADDP